MNDNHADSAATEREPRPERRRLESWVVDSFRSRLNANNTMFSDASLEDSSSRRPQTEPQE